MKSYRHIIIFLLTSFVLFSCNESASSKIKPDNQNKTQYQASYAEITFDRIFHDFGAIKEGEIVKTVRLLSRFDYIWLKLNYGKPKWI